MMHTSLDVHALTPLLFRDGRPFNSDGEESRAHSLPAPLPHTVAGFIRTQLGHKHGWNWRDDRAFHEYLTRLHGVSVQSLLVRDGQFMFPAPLNAAVNSAGQVLRSAPQDTHDAGTNLPAGLRPVVLQTDQMFKPEGGYAYWSGAHMTAWLLNQNPGPLDKITGPPTEERTHVGIDSARGVAQEQQLFSVTYRSFEEHSHHGQMHRWALRVRTNAAHEVASLGYLGGERRPVTLQAVPEGQVDWPDLKQFEQVKQALLNESERRICFILTSPALFSHGWRPAWLTEDTGSHNPRGVGVLRGRATLVGASVGRRIPVSGWNIRENRPKAVRWAVPAGSVYFLELPQDFSRTEREKLISAWLKPLSDNQNDQRDGFGSALWGVW